MNIKNNFMNHISVQFWKWTWQAGSAGSRSHRQERTTQVRKFQESLQRGDNWLLLEKWERF